jgi:hypothetical protein
LDCVALTQASFRQPGDTEPAGVIPLLDCSVMHTPPHESAREHAFEINTRARNYFLAAESAADAQNWVEAIERAKAYRDDTASEQTKLFNKLTRVLTAWEVCSFSFPFSYVFFFFLKVRFIPHSFRSCLIRPRALPNSDTFHFRESPLIPRDKRSDTVKLCQRREVKNFVALLCCCTQELDFFDIRAGQFRNPKPLRPRIFF